MTDLKETWEKLDPKSKQRVVLGIVLSVLMLGLYAYASSNEQNIRTRNTPEKVNITSDILTGRDTSSLGIEGNQIQIKKIRAEQAKISQDMESFKAQIEEDLGRKDIKLLESKLIEMDTGQKNQERQMKDMSSSLENIRESLNQQGVAVMERGKLSATPQTSNSNNSAIWDQEEAGPYDNEAIPGNSTANPKNALKINIISQKEDPSKKGEDDEKGETIFIPAGTILSGTLITGMDAPTNETTKSNPFPTLLRIKDDAILPNRFRMDIRECFIIASGYGDLSSERAYIRGETISCISNDEEILESGIDLFAVGEDGKAGLRGRMVSKTGQVLGRAMMAGFMESITTAFSPQPVGAISLTPGGSVGYQSQITTDAVKSAGLAGASSAAKTLADYYIKIAEGIHPVIEIDAGRKIDMIVKKGMKLVYTKYK